MSTPGGSTQAVCPYPDCMKTCTCMWEVCGRFEDGSRFTCGWCGREVEVRDVLIVGTKMDALAMTYSCHVVPS